MKSDFAPFRVGTVFNPIKVDISAVKLAWHRVVIEYPTRLNAMALDPSKIAHNSNLVYRAGEVIFVVDLCRRVRVEIHNVADQLRISARSRRKPLISHAYLIMKQVLGFRDGLAIDVTSEHDYRHVGLGSSSGLIASVACAINELYGQPIPLQQLITYVAQNHGEEIDNSNEYLAPVQCIGGSAAGGMSQGGVMVLTGEARVVASLDLPACYKAVIGVPKDFQAADSKQSLALEIENFDRFERTGSKYAQYIAYRMLHECLPGLANKSLRPLADLIYEYRYEMGSIDNCSFIYPGITGIADNLRWLKEEHVAEVLSLSSVGPAMFAITDKPMTCAQAFSEEGLTTFHADIHNQTYQIVDCD